MGVWFWKLTAVLTSRRMVMLTARWSLTRSRSQKSYACTAMRSWRSGREWIRMRSVYEGGRSFFAAIVCR